MSLIKITYAPDELTAEEHLALNYCLAMLEPEKFAQPFLVVWNVAKKLRGEGQMRRDRNVGLEGLMEKGIVTGCARDGHRDWEVVGGQTVLHGERLSQPLIQRTHLGSGAVITDEGD